MVDLINHENLAISRLATQFRESENLKEYIKAFLKQSDELETVYQSFLSKFDLETAEGDQLDILGKIVGQDRILLDAVVLFYFGYFGALGAQSFGSLSDPELGARFREIGESTTGNRLLVDDEYREFIRARIVKNSITPTNEEMSAFFRLLFNVQQVHIVDVNGAMNYTVKIGKILSDNERVFLLLTDLVPKVAAVGVGYEMYSAGEAFGYQGFPGALGFGSVSNPSIGGVFGQIVTIDYDVYEDVDFAFGGGAGDPTTLGFSSTTSPTVGGTFVSV